VRPDGRQVWIVTPDGVVRDSRGQLHRVLLEQARASTRWRRIRKRPVAPDLAVDSAAMEVAALVGLMGFILLKETGIPLPVPGDLVIIGTGAYLANDLPSAGVALGAMLVAGYVGASAQFFLFGTALRRPLLAALERLGIGAARLEGLAERFRAAGSKAVALTRMTPGVRIAVIPAAAIAALPYRVFLAGIVVGNGVFVTAHFAAGFLLGNYARDLVERASDPMVVVVIALIVLAVGGLVVLRRRSAPTKPADTFECWSDCSCPACVAMVAMGTAGQPIPG
jgi:membrane protein DedA with SNARE-associated domain